jgi:molybdopterin-guanine dinucleotide biosynthesis protein A
VDQSAVILIGGLTDFVGQDLAIQELKGKPVIARIVDAMSPLVDEVIIVVKTNAQAESYSKLVEPSAKFVVNEKEEKGLLFDALTGFKAVQGKHSLLLSSEFALVSADIVTLFFDLCHGKSAVVPRWPNQNIEPLQAVYHTKTALEAAKLTVEEGLFDIEAMVDYMGGVRYISTLAVQEFDPELKTFFKVNTPVELKMAEALSKPRRIKGPKKR